jgi:hypothetical protein
MHEHCMHEFDVLASSYLLYQHCGYISLFGQTSVAKNRRHNPGPFPSTKNSGSSAMSKERMSKCSLQRVVVTFTRLYSCSSGQLSCHAGAIIE